MVQGSAVPMAAVILAGDRGGKDPVVAAAGVACKALLPIAGRPMVLRVVEALRSSPLVGPIYIVGPTAVQLQASPELEDLLEQAGVSWVAPSPGPCRSTSSALERIPEDQPVLVTTADHALLDVDMLSAFLSDAKRSGADLAVAVASRAGVRAAWPGARRTGLRLRDGDWCGCNLFALLTPAARRAPAFWQRVEGARKRPWLMAWLLGWGTLLLFLTRRLTLASGLRRLGRRAGLDLHAVVMDQPAAAVDVDTVADWNMVREALAGTAHPADAGDGFSSQGTGADRESGPRGAGSGTLEVSRNC